MRLIGAGHWNLIRIGPAEPGRTPEDRPLTAGQARETLAVRAAHPSRSARPRGARGSPPRGQGAIPIPATRPARGNAWPGPGWCGPAVTARTPAAAQACYDSDGMDLGRDSDMVIGFSYLRQRGAAATAL